jgi:hypothetical protein
MPRAPGRKFSVVQGHQSPVCRAEMPRAPAGRKLAEPEIESARDEVHHPRSARSYGCRRLLGPGSTVLKRTPPGAPISLLQTVTRPWFTVLNHFVEIGCVNLLADRYPLTTYNKLVES